MIYRPSILTRGLSLATIVIFIGCIYSLLVYPISDFDSADKIFFAFILLVASIILVTILTSKIKVTDDAIELKALLNRQKILFSNILGYKSDINSTVLILKDGSKIFTTKNKELSKWISEKFQRLGPIPIEKFDQHILKDDRYGTTNEKKVAKLSDLNKIVITVTSLGVLLVVCSLIISEFTSNGVIIGLCFIFPFFVLSIYHHYNGAIPFFKKSGNSQLSFSWGITIPIAFAAISMCVDYKIIDYNRILCISVIVALLCGVIGFKVTDANREVKSLSLKFGIILLSLLYGYGVTVYINCDWDNSKSTSYTAIVSDKYTSRGKHGISYHFTLSPWGPSLDERSIRTNEKLYFHTSIGNTLDIQLKKGLLGAQWFDIPANNANIINSD